MGAVTYTSPCFLWGDGQDDRKLMRAGEIVP